jgi:putative PEP-CTERM system TPR-repeat lipoprotein
MIRTDRAVRAAAALVFAFAALLAGCGKDQTPEALTASAKQYMAKQDYAAAVIQLKNALQQQPNNGELRYLLGVALLERHDPVSAEKELRRALELKHPAEQIYEPLARALLAMGQADKVAAELGDKTLADKATQAALATSIGRAQLALGRAKEAHAAFASALAAQPDYAPAQLGQARLIAAEGNLAEAAKRVDDVLAKSPGNADALFLRGELLVTQGKPQEAIAALEQSADADPNDVRARQALVSLLIDQSDYARAAAQLEQAKKTAKGDPRVDYLEALLAFREGKPAAARDAVLRVLKIAPEHVPSLILAGAIEYQADAFAQAESYLRKALERAPRQIVARRLLVASYLRLGQPDRALEALQPLLAQQTVDPASLQLAGEVYLANGDLKSAAQYFERAAAADSKSSAVKTRLAQVRFAAGDVDRAVKDLEAVSEADPDQIQADVTLILGHLRRNELDKALAAAKRLEKKRPQAALSHNLTGAVHVARRDPRAARASFEQALALDSAYLPALQNLASLDMQEQKPAQARKRYEDALAKAPSNTQLLLSYAEFLRASGADSKEAFAVIERAVGANPTLAPARLALIDAYMRAGDAKQALIAAQQAATALPNDARVLTALGTVQQANGDFNQAIATFQKVVATAPQDAGALVRLAGAHAAAKDYAAAVQTLRKALALQPNAVDLNREIALLQMRAGHPDEALAEARAVQAGRPKEAAGYVIEGDVYAAQKKLPEAAKAYRAALAITRTPAIAIRLHAALDGAGNTKEADQFAAAWIKENPKDVQLRTYLADRDLRAKNYKSAMAHYRAILEQTPNDPIMLNNLAWVAGTLKDPQAVTYAEQAHRLAPSNVAIMDTLGWLLVEKGDTARGVELLRKASSLAPAAAEIRLNLAKAYVKAGQKDAARKEIEVLLKAPDGSPHKDEAAALMKTL